ncbi:MAG: hypothetical protein ACXACP_07085 [Candidatus Hodarchaeales archaeon]|jgi:hypothetical protein
MFLFKSVVVYASDFPLYIQYFGLTEQEFNSNMLLTLAHTLSFSKDSVKKSLSLLSAPQIVVEYGNLITIMLTVEIFSEDNKAEELQLREILRQLIHETESRYKKTLRSNRWTKRHSTLLGKVVYQYLCGSKRPAQIMVDVNPIY